jgi:GDP-L-fucose synthase
MDTASRIFVAGHGGMVGRALGRRLAAEGFRHVLTAARADLDLRDPRAVRAFFERVRPDYVVLAAARGGGIQANRTHPADFIEDNLLIATSVLAAAHAAGVRRLLHFGCACAYPRQAPPPMKETDLLTGPLEPTSEAFAVAKLAGIKMGEAYNRQHGTPFVAVMPASVYGPHDDFGLDSGHVLSALIRKCDEARRTGGPVVVWGTGTPRREFLYVDDLADACLHLLRLDAATFAGLAAGPSALVNVGTGEDVSVRDLAGLVAEAVGFTGAVEYDTSRPDGAPRKLLDSSRMAALGWTPRTTLKDGIRRTCEWYNRRDLFTK